MLISLHAVCYRIRAASVACAMMLVVCILGCSSPNPASVSGNVTLDGHPLTTGTVSFYPDGGNGAPASGQIDGSGNYSLNTGTDSGLTPGKYIAIVIATKAPPQPYDKTGAEIPPIPITPGKYGNANTSDLRFEVKPGKNVFALELKAK